VTASPPKALRGQSPESLANLVGLATARIKARKAHTSKPLSLIDFVQRFNPEYQPGALHRLIAEKIEQALAKRCVHCNRSREECIGEDHEFRPLNRLMVFVAPQTGKSELVSIMAPAKYLAENPDQYWVAASYAETLAARNSRHARNLVRSPEFQDLYPVRLSRASNSVTEWEFEGHRGGLYAVGVGGALTGRVASVLCIDDPVKDRQDADSETVREGVWDWWKSVARTRLNPESVAIVVLTRWRHDDLAGRILNGVDDQPGEGRIEDGGSWLVVEIPALADEDDPLGREYGEPLMIPHHRHANLEAAREWFGATRDKIGPRDWSALYQQRPSQDTDAIFPESWWGWYDWSAGSLEQAPPEFLYTVQAWDTALKDGNRNDYHACVTLGVTGEAIYVLDAWRKRMQFPELIQQIQNRRALYRPTHLPIEDKASGTPAVQALQETIPEIYEWSPGVRDKVSRAFAVQPRISKGQVKLPRQAEWLRTFLDEASSFPLGSHDDLVDAFTSAMLVAAELTGKWSALQVSVGGLSSGWIDPRYVDTDTRNAPSPDLVRQRF
jgi:predicted phage terminase large subunit-like protein